MLVQIIEIYVAVGDNLEEDQPIVALESEKASMDIPASISGKVTALKINVGDTVSEGDALIELEVSDAESVVNAEETEQEQESEATQKTTSKSAMHTISVPDVGGAKDVQVIEIYVAVGDSLEEEQPIVALESDKASMEIPSTMAGKITVATTSKSAASSKLGSCRKPGGSGSNERYSTSFGWHTTNRDCAGSSCRE